MISAHRPHPYSVSLAVSLGIAIFLFAFIPHVGLPTEIEPLADPVSLQLLLDGKELPTPQEAEVAEYLGRKVPSLGLSDSVAKPHILGVSYSLNKHIEVDLTNQRVYAYEGNQKVYEFVVSTGLWGRTPTGTFSIWSKVRSQKMEGGNRAINTYYYLPNVPHVMFFYNEEVPKMRGFSFHGAYWHNNFGHPMSHGCINMKLEDAKLLYEWANPVVTNERAWSTLSSLENPGTKVVIYGQTPSE